MGAAPVRHPSGHNKLEQILASATKVFCEKGYEGAGIRDIARRSRVSLAGLYYYVKSKEELLYLIQKHCFTTLLVRLGKQLDGRRRDPETKLRLLIRNHLEYFLQNREAMKVLSHESDSLQAPYAREVAEIKRSYYRLCRGILEELKRQRQLQHLNTRLAVMSLFGMMNWIYTWHNPRVDPDAEALADHMSSLFFAGIQSGGQRRARTRGSGNGQGRRAG